MRRLILNGLAAPKGTITMSVRKRAWTTSKGETKEAWIVDYVDQKGERHIRTFAKKKPADAYHATVKVEVRDPTSREFDYFECLNCDSVIDYSPPKSPRPAPRDE
jgi:hypothetical protein